MDTKRPIQVTRPSIPALDDFVQEVSSLWVSRWLTNGGQKHQELVSKLKNYLQAPDIALFANGHLALESVISAFSLQGEVITTPFTFASTSHAIVRNGLTPVFCDINPDDYTIDVDKLEPLINKRTVAILPVHVYGNICNVEGLAHIAEQHNLKVIYDAAHAFGTTLNGQGVASFGDASMFSFHATKVFHTIEGGAVAFKDESLGPKISAIRNFGLTGPESVEYIGINAKMNEFQAAMGLCNLRHIDEEIAGRKAVVGRYIERLNGIPGIKLNMPQPGVSQNYAYFPVLFDGFRLNRNQVFDALAKEGIHARKYFYPTINSMPCYKERYRCEPTPVAEFVAARVLTLPLYAELALEDADRVCDIILRLIGR